ncbi:ABC transporter substrate-binding protein [Actinomadura sp. NBRC 104412]|uniref:transporter substrate-binding domain-containing protein n=1 Tax=Actinomadura sp. NBRC 104412 TaxID=3032203 RepID=UPI0024A169C5|nr:transporter substrate-binding domain-containing protein [Actinomadura sp. NBRC 104412]GLZ02979.1 ABC transporter substrate-binding protein [Actinomadura sp. NBRC 104412]
MRFIGSVAAVCAALGLLSGCAGEERSPLLDKRTLVAGVRPDLPGLGYRHPDGRFEGLDVDVARYLARRLGKEVRFVPALAANRIRLLRDGEVDLVLTFWVEPQWKAQLTFAGPYYLSYQDILVRDGERGVRGVRDLAGRRICAVTGAGAAEQVTEERQVPATPVTARNYDQCAAMLADGRIDAITTNDTILAGIKMRKGAGFRLLNARFGERRTGIGMRQGDPGGCEAVNKAITQMYQDGTMARLMAKWFGRSGLDLSDVAVPQFEGCL